MIQASQSVNPPDRRCASIGGDHPHLLLEHLDPASEGAQQATQLDPAWHTAHWRVTHLCRSPDVPGFWPVQAWPCLSHPQLRDPLALDQAVDAAPAYGFVDTSLGLKSVMAACLAVRVCDAMLCSICVLNWAEGDPLCRRRLSPLPSPGPEMTLGSPTVWTGRPLKGQSRTRTDFKRGEAHTLLADGMRDYASRCCTSMRQTEEMRRPQAHPMYFAGKGQPNLNPSSLE